MVMSSETGKDWLPDAEALKAVTLVMDAALRLFEAVPLALVVAVPVELPLVVPDVFVVVPAVLSAVSGVEVGPLVVIGFRIVPTVRAFRDITVEVPELSRSKGLSWGK